MTRAVLLCLLLVPALAADRTDLLRLDNGELEGRFGGIGRDGILRWERDDGVGPIEFRTDRLRQIILHGGEAVHPAESPAHVTLADGDRLPGRVLGFSDGLLKLETRIAGTLSLPRDAVRSLAPNPFGGRLLYAGPYSEEGWQVLDPSAADEEDPDAEPVWRYRGGRWYFTGGLAALGRDVDLPVRSIFRTTVSWRSRPPLVIAFHADFAHPPDDELEGQGGRSPRHLAAVFGNAYVLNLRSSYAQLQHCGYDADGNAFIDQIRASATNVDFGQDGESVVEIRSNLDDGLIALHVNGQFMLQWYVDQPVLAQGQGAERPRPEGTGIGYQIPGGDTPLRISDIVIAEWNGMPDSARSMESDSRDVVLMSNGTDRFSGSVEAIEDGRVRLKNRYAELEIPYEEVAEIHFARGRRQDPIVPDEPTLRVHFQPVGRLGGRVIEATRDQLILASPLAGELHLDLGPARILEFANGAGFLDYWEDDL